MARLVYGPELFTVGSDTELHAYDPNWVSAGAAFGINTLSVRASTDNVQMPTAGEGTGYRWMGVTLVDQRVIATLVTSATCIPGIIVRCDGSENCYFAEWNVPDGHITLYRVLAGTPTNIATGGTVTAATYANCFVKVTGVGATVTITVGDDTNGTVITFGDTDGNRRTAGQPGLIGYDDAGLSGSYDDVSIYDELSTASPPIQQAPGSVGNLSIHPVRD